MPLQYDYMYFKAFKVQEKISTSVYKNSTIGKLFFKMNRKKLKPSIYILLLGKILFGTVQGYQI